MAFRPPFSPREYRKSCKPGNCSGPHLHLSAAHEHPELRRHKKSRDRHNTERPVLPGADNSAFHPFSNALTDRPTGVLKHKLPGTERLPGPFTTNRPALSPSTKPVPKTLSDERETLTGSFVSSGRPVSLSARHPEIITAADRIINILLMPIQ